MFLRQSKADEMGRCKLIPDEENADHHFFTPWRDLKFEFDVEEVLNHLSDLYFRLFKYHSEFSST